MFKRFSTSIFSRAFSQGRIQYSNNTKLQLYADFLEIPSISKFHYSWLRDNCQCPKCFHPRTKQKLHSSGSIDGCIKPLKAEISGDSLLVSWPPSKCKWFRELNTSELIQDIHLVIDTPHYARDEHSSVYRIDWLKSVDYYKEHTPLIKPKLWDSKIYRKARETVDYKEFLKPQGFNKVLAQIRDYGLAFLKNVPTENHTRGKNWIKVLV